jgi:3-methylcrotonyl-CoA carboxylase alpha subunit
VLVFREGERQHAVSALRRGEGFELELGGRRRFLKGYRMEEGRLTVQLDGATVAGRVARLGSRFDVFLPGERYCLELHDPLLQELDEEAHAGELVAPMPGKIIAVLVKAGDQVDKGAPLLILEAMKMEHTIKAPAPGRIARIRHGAGEQVSEGTELIDFEAES